MTHTNNNKLDCPQYLEYWTCDGVAENLNNVNWDMKDGNPIENENIETRTYVHIWDVLVVKMEEDMKKSFADMGYNSISHYLENQGGDDGSYGELNEIGKYWHLLEDDMKDFLIEFSSARLKQDEEDAMEDAFNNPNN